MGRTGHDERGCYHAIEAKAMIVAFHSFAATPLSQEGIWFRRRSGRWR